MPLSGQIFVTLVTIGGYAVMKTIRRRDLRNAAAASAAKKEDSVIISSDSGEQGNDEMEITNHEVGVDDILISFIKTLVVDTSRMAKKTLEVVAEINQVVVTCIVVEAYAIFYLLTMPSTEK